MRYRIIPNNQMGYFVQVRRFGLWWTIEEYDVKRNFGTKHDARVWIDRRLVAEKNLRRHMKELFEEYSDGKS